MVALALFAASNVCGRGNGARLLVGGHRPIATRASQRRARCLRSAPNGPV